MKPCLIMGAGNHAKVLLDTLRQLNVNNIIGFADISHEGVKELSSLPILDQAKCLEHKQPSDIVLLNGVGGLPGMNARQTLFDEWHSVRAFEFMQLVHPSCYVSPQAVLGHGVQILARAVLQTGCQIKNNVLINTGAILDHDCIIGEHSVIAPGAVLCGNVHVEERAYVGANATVIQGVTIGKGSVVAAGAVVIKDVPPNTLVRGVPARGTVDGSLATRLSQTHNEPTRDTADN